MIRVTLSDATVGTGASAALPPVSATFSSGAATLLATEGGNRPTVLSLVASGRMKLHGGSVSAVRLEPDGSSRQLSPAQLRLEISETVINQDPEGSLEILHGLASLKVRAALDNFGAGLASMNHLIRLPIDLVKVDRRLIAYLPIPGKQATILQTIFDLGRMLQVRMLAEGIERKEQLDALLQYGCDFGQGHFFSTPVSQEKAQELLEKGHWRL